MECNYEQSITNHIPTIDSNFDNITQITEYIPKKKIEDKIKEYEELVKEFEKTDNSGRFKRTNSIDYYKLEALKELLEE